MTSIVVLPGLDGTGLLLDAFVRELGAEFEVDRVTYPTHEALDYAQLTDRVARALPSSRSYVLLAESFSGPIACRVAARNPPGLVGVVFCASFVSSPLPALRRFAALLRLAPVRSVPVALLAAVLLGRWSSSAHVTALKRALHCVDPRVLRLRAGAALAAAPPVVGSIRVPVLYLQAGSDRLISRASLDRLRRIAPSTTVTVIPGPHFLLQVAPQACAAAVRSFARSVVAAS
jgi:pimeloyl-[acyl-carrier protein] methyl ester esterase